MRILKIIGVFIVLKFMEFGQFIWSLISGLFKGIKSIFKGILNFFKIYRMYLFKAFIIITPPIIVSIVFNIIDISKKYDDNQILSMFVGIVALSYLAIVVVIFIVSLIKDNFVPWLINLVTSNWKKASNIIDGKQTFFDKPKKTVKKKVVKKTSKRRKK
jgi:hypothetical protein